jgi:hypothetical protein
MNLPITTAAKRLLNFDGVVIVWITYYGFGFVCGAGAGFVWRGVRSTWRAVAHSASVAVVAVFVADNGVQPLHGLEHRLALRKHGLTLTQPALGLTEQSRGSADGVAAFGRKPQIEK